MSKKEVSYLKNDKIYLQNCTISKEGRIENTKTIAELTDDDQISIVSDAMFKTMLCTVERKKYVCKLLSELLQTPYEYLLNNAEYYKNELDKDTVDAKGERGDLVLKLEDRYILVEMNMRDEVSRNVEYGDRLYRSKIKIGSEYIYPDILCVSFDNYYYKELSSTPIRVFYVQDDEGICLVKKTYVTISIPLLMKKWYTVGVKELSNFEKTTLVMVSTDRNRILELVSGDDMMKNYIEDAKNVEKDDTILKEAYDHELSARKAEREIGYEKGLNEGHERGRRIIEGMLKKMTVAEISELCDIPLEELEKIIGQIENSSK